MANGTLAVARLALSHAVRLGWITANPARSLGLDGVPPRVVVWTPSEIEALLAAADALGLPQIGDAIVIALHTGQRQGDVLRLEMPQIEGGRAFFRQGKRGARVAMPLTPQLASRIDAIRGRRRRTSPPGKGRPVWQEKDAKTALEVAIYRAVEAVVVNDVLVGIEELQFDEELRAGSARAQRPVGKRDRRQPASRPQRMPQACGWLLWRRPWWPWDRRSSRSSRWRHASPWLACRTPPSCCARCWTAGMCISQVGSRAPCGPSAGPTSRGRLSRPWTRRAWRSRSLDLSTWLRRPCQGVARNRRTSSACA
jgi:hypothetical protein